ncbi:hypothetical protein RND81_05G064300 [Saponaria officinalis]|uniref:Uncharacterized protein n=1 Tax=Saponaria officinalis TaxID=3572 RepID=A0AAW1KYG1_SAPOF
MTENEEEGAARKGSAQRTKKWAQRETGVEENPKKQAENNSGDQTNQWLWKIGAAKNRAMRRTKNERIITVSKKQRKKREVLVFGFWVGRGRRMKLKENE